MPIPTPNPGESQAEYVSRAMHVVGNEYADKKQALAVCYSKYREHRKSARKSKAGRRKTRKMYVRKNAATEVGRALMAGVSLLTQNSQGDIYYDKASQVVRVVLRPDRDDSLMQAWKSKVAEVIGINEQRISVSERAPKDWGQASSWVRVTPSGEVEIDPGLEAVTEEPAHSGEINPQSVSFDVQKLDEEKVSAIMKAVNDNGGKWNLGPVLVSSGASEGTYDPIDGRHRIEAARRLGLTSIPATIDPPESDLKTVSDQRTTISGEPMDVKIAARYEGFETICKVDDEDPDFTFVLAPALIPDKLDRQGDAVDSAEIEKAAHWHVENSQQTGLLHKASLAKRDVVLVESYIVRSKNYVVNGTSIPEGTWMCGYRVYNPQMRRALKRGFLKGISIGADAKAHEL